MTETASLKEIEESLYVLLTRSVVRQKFLSGNTIEQIDRVHRQVASLIDQRGVALYACLIRHGQKDLINSIYPGCAKVIGKGFENLIYRYMETCPPEHYNFNQAAAAFSDFLNSDSKCQPLIKKYPFLPELADYEWVELEVLEHPARDECGEKIELDQLDKFQDFAPIVNRTLVMRNYQYPIDKIVDWLKDDIKLPSKVKKNPVCLAVYRTPSRSGPRFLALAQASASIVEAARTAKTSFGDLLKIAVGEDPTIDPQSTVLAFLALVEKLESLELFVGSSRI